MRGAAAVMVAVYHLGEQWHFAASSYLAVDLFFLLSGVVMASAYDARIASGMTTAAFMRLRLIRLYTMYLAGVLACLATGAVFEPVTPAILASSLFMLPSPGSLVLYPVLGAAWSLFFELLANLLFVALHRHLTTRRLLALCSAAGVALGLLTWTYGDASGGWDWATVWIAVPRVLFSFFGGVLIWRHRARLTFAIRPAIALVAVVLVCLYQPGSRVLFDLAIVALIWPALVIGGMNATDDVPVLAWLGAVSYPLYCLHGAFKQGPMVPTTLVAALALVAVCIAASWAAHHYFDAPVRGWLARRTAPT